jgi:hypothetical protein
LVFSTLRSEVCDLWFKRADKIGGGIDDLNAKVGDAVWLRRETARHFGWVWIKPDAQIRSAETPCSIKTIKKCHEVTLRLRSPQ